MAFVSAISATSLHRSSLLSSTATASSSSSFVSARRGRASVSARNASWRVCRMTATEDKKPPAAKAGGAAAAAAASKSLSDESPVDVVIDENIAGFCSINPRTGKRVELSLREKESLFLDAMQAYFNGEKMLSNEEFDNLKEELTWQGSDVVTLSRDEFRFLDAAKAYEQGNPNMDDAEFDALKKRLFDAGSIVAIARGPRCSVQRKLTFSDIIPDKKRTLALYAPATLLASLVWLSAAFELTPLHKIDPVLSLLVGTPIIYIVARVLTQLVVPRGEIMVGDCPSCGRRTHVLFGNVLNQKGFEDVADVKCEKCKAILKVEKETGRMILVSES